MKATKGKDGQLIFDQSDRAELVADPARSTYRKRARIVAVQMTAPFMVYTDRGPMQGSPGDWLVTNHPDDDPGSDVWSISNERMLNTYEPTE